MFTATDLCIRVFVADYLHLDPSWWHYKNAKSSFWRLYYNIHPGMTVQAGGVIYPIDACCPYLIPSGLSLNLDCDDKLEHLYIHFDIMGITTRALIRHFNKPIPIPNHSTLLPMLERLMKLLQRGRNLDLQVECQSMATVYQAFALLFSELTDSEALALSGVDVFAEDLLPAIRAVDEFLDWKLSVAWLSRECGMSCGRFAKRFKHAFGKTPVQYIHERRITVAEQRLIATNRSIEQIAEETGFTTREYFTRVFTRVMGCSPALYRAKARSLSGQSLSDSK